MLPRRAGPAWALACIANNLQLLEISEVESAEESAFQLSTLIVDKEKGKTERTLLFSSQP